MSEIPKCNGELASLKVYIEPNAPEPGSYTVHFLQPDAGGIGFNAAHVSDLPRVLNGIKEWVEQQKGFTRICQEDGDYYIESTSAIDSQVHLTPLSYDVNLAQIFKEANSKQSNRNAAAPISVDSVIPKGGLESIGRALHKRKKYTNAQQVFDHAILKPNEITTAAGWYYVGLTALKVLEFEFFHQGKHDLAPDEPVDSATFRRIVMLYGAATAFALAAGLVVDEEDPILDLANERKAAALTALDRLGQIDDSRLIRRKSELSPRPFTLEGLPEETAPSMPPGELRERIADAEMTLEEDPDNPVTLIRLALHFSDAGKLKEAINLAERAVTASEAEDKEKRIVYLESLVDIYNRAGKEHVRGRIRALERLVKATVTKRQTNYAWMELAELYIEVGKLGKAQEAAENAIIQAQRLVKSAERQHKDPDPRRRKFAEFTLKKSTFNLARTHNFLGDILMARYEKNRQSKRARTYLEDAAKEYVRALKNDAWNIDYMLGWAQAQHKLGNDGEAVRMVEAAIRVDVDNAKATRLLDDIVLSKEHPEKGLERVSGQMSAHSMVAYGMSKLKSAAQRLAQPLAEAIQVFRSTIEFYPKNIEARYRLGMTLYGISMHPMQRDDPRYKEEALASLMKAMDLLSKDPDKELKAHGVIADNAYVEMLVALVTLATELNRLGIALEYLENAENLDNVKVKSHLRPNTIYQHRNSYMRELEAVDKLLNLVSEDERTEHRLCILRWILFGGLETEGSEKPKTNGDSGAPPAPYSTPAPTSGSPTPSGTPSGAAAAGWNGQSMADVGGFDNSGEELFPDPSTTSAAILYNETNVAGPNAGAIQAIKGFGITSLGTPLSAGQIAPLVARPAGALVR